MIDKKDIDDCCDNCLEGEPCCDEQLQLELEQIIETEGVTTDIQPLINCLCCPSKFYVIQNTLHGLTEKEIIDLRTELRKHTKTGTMHKMLENYFTAVIDEINQA